MTLSDSGAPVTTAASDSSAYANMAPLPVQVSATATHTGVRRPASGRRIMTRMPATASAAIAAFTTSPERAVYSQPGW